MDAWQQAVKRSSASVRRRLKSVAKGGTCGGEHMILRQHAGGEVASASQQVVLPQKIFGCRCGAYGKSTVTMPRVDEACRSTRCGQARPARVDSARLAPCLRLAGAPSSAEGFWEARRSPRASLAVRLRRHARLKCRSPNSECGGPYCVGRKFVPGARTTDSFCNG